jgi:hypothetical protein
VPRAATGSPSLPADPVAFGEVADIPDREAATPAGAAVGTTVAAADPEEVGPGAAARTEDPVENTARATETDRATTLGGADALDETRRGTPGQSGVQPLVGLATLTEWIPGNAYGRSFQLFPESGLTNSWPVVVPT